jgi:hypothetical protein
MYKDARELALNAMVPKLTGDAGGVSKDLLERVVDAAWAHQRDAEPRRQVRDKIKEEISRSANLIERSGETSEI